ncbi:hypothetical protein [Afipia sp. DC4300-2b1]|uniref:hypothetical protein n=1 Tax=Afipia sp. DC4300-2b1 TaxID=2804672 RepID=UPI003CF504D3
MLTKQDASEFASAFHERHRLPITGMQFLHQPAVTITSSQTARSSLRFNDLIKLLRRYFVVRRRSAALADIPLCRCAMHVLTPGGQRAVQIFFKKSAFGVEKTDIGNREVCT